MAARARLGIVALALVAAAAGCTNVQEVPEGDGAIVADSIGADPGGGDGGVADQVEGDDSGGLPEVVGCDPPASFRCPCTENDDCASSLCIEGVDGPACTKECVSKCPDGYDCLQAGVAGSDPVSMCVPRHVRLCRPCETDLDCDHPQDPGVSLCLPALDPDEGSFCGTSCAGGITCPVGYSCQVIALDGGGEARQCVPTSGHCECRESWASMDLSTDCTLSNDFGSCPGTRSCGPDGLTSCTGQLPAPETCNGADDDCNGTEDDIEATACAIENEHGSCPGNLACDDAGTEAICAGRAPAPESCNGEDDDCDGFTDEETCADGLECTSDVCTADTQCLNELVAGYCLIGGACVAEGEPNPADPCEQCLPAVSTSSWADAEGNACNDGQACTRDDLCSGGVCSGTPYVCNDGLACTDDTCDGAGGCAVVIAPGSCVIDGACVADGAGQTAGSCLVCDAEASPQAWLANDGGSCDDGDPCTADDLCDGATCGGALYDCDDGDACTLDTCDGDGTCTHSQAEQTCVIGGECYAAGTPNPGQACLACRPGISATTWSPLDQGSACDDGLPCTQGDQCVAGACQGTPYVCSDGLGCTTDSCNGDGSCTFSPAAGKCAIDDACWNDGAEAPGQPCLYCDAAGSPAAWKKRPTGTSCDDGLSCTSDDACDSAGACTGSAQQCDDGLWCTVDTCDGTGGCIHTPTSGCLIGGKCLSNGVPNQLNPCEKCNTAVSTTDWSPASGAVCSDNNPCTKNDVCQAGTCVGTAYSCSDSLACTSDVCDGTGGCSNPILPGKCVIGGTCYDNGVTRPGDICSRCNSVYPTHWSDNNGISCDDGNDCTGNDKCFGGTCTGAYVKDGFEYNDTRATARILGDVKDSDSYPKGSINASLYGPDDVDWYSYQVADTFGFQDTQPRADLKNIPTNNNYKLCIYYSCAQGTTNISCVDGQATTLDGLPGCCSDNPGGASETVKFNPSCDCGLLCTDDSGTAYLRVTRTSGTWTCDAYSLDWGDD